LLTSNLKINIILFEIKMSSAIPQNQNAAVRIGSGETARAPVTQIPVPTPSTHEILVKITWSGLCASDKSILRDSWSSFGVIQHDNAHGIVGHEGAGIVVSVGSDVQDLWKVGDRAGIKWVASICGICEMCTNGVDEVHCPKQTNSGFTTPGTFQEYCVTDGRYATHLPDAVKDEEAGPIMCGGVTAYVACKRSVVKPGQWIVLPGAGGGLGHFAVQYAKAMGMRVIAVDGGKEKEELCMKLGAEKFIDFTNCEDVVAEVMKITTWGAHGVIVTAASKEGYESAPMMLRPGGTMVVSFS
jgi:propanol-preferring alcohol dehydrogenase